MYTIDDLCYKQKKKRTTEVILLGAMQTLDALLVFLSLNGLHQRGEFILG